MNNARQRLEQKQRLRILPGQLQLVPLLEMNGEEVRDHIEQEIATNPALEVKSEPDEQNLEKTEDGETYRESPDEMQRKDYGDDDDMPVYHANNRSQDDEYYEPTAIAEESITDYLMSQVRERDITKEEELIAEYIIGNLDEGGYLRRSPQAIADDITFSGNLEVETAQVKKVLTIVRELDPPGIGATDLRDCILLQLQRMDDNGSVRLAISIVEHYFNEFSHKHYDKICMALNITDDQLKKAIDVIKSVNPKPGSAYSGSDSERRTQQLTPDFQIEIDDEDPENPQLLMTLLNKIPELQISESYTSIYRKMMQRADKKATQKSEVAVVKDAYERANDFISVLRRRQEKLALTMEAIMERQHDFLLTGDERKLKPMVLNDIAQITGLDTSVISRVTSGKYVTTPWGVFSLKHFFSEGLMHEAGEEVSAREICSVLKELVDGEDKRHPLSDEKLCADLQERGYHIARRTIAKYRERLKIPVARLRKEM
jgi:RNA polymerase sigma-54 factor